MDIQKTPFLYPHFRTCMAHLTQLRLFFAITLIITFTIPLYCHDQEDSAANHAYQAVINLSAPTNSIYEQIARSFYTKLGLDHSSNSLSIVADNSVTFMTTKSYGFYNSPDYHHVICINEAQCATLTLHEIEFLIAHEIAHISLGHHRARMPNSSISLLHQQKYAADITAALFLGTAAGGISFCEKQQAAYTTHAPTHPLYADRCAALHKAVVLP